MIEFTRDILVDLGGWAVLKEAKSLVERKRVKAVSWENKLLRGEVEVGGTGYFPRLNLRSLTFAENRCNCSQGKRGVVCAHAIALCLIEMEGGLGAGTKSTDDPEQEAIDEESECVEEEPKQLTSLVLSEEKGVPGRFRVLLPPNLSVSARKDKIMVKVEFELATGQVLLPEKIDRGKAYRLNESQQKVGAEIESFCGGKLHGLMQLKSVQLRSLLEPLEGEPCVYWINRPTRPIEWIGDELEGVHRFLKVDESTPSTRKPEPRKPASLQRGLFTRGSRFENERESDTRLTFLEVDGSPNYLSIKLPSREDSGYFELYDLMKGSGFKLEPSNGRWWLRDKHRTLNFLSDHYAELKDRFRARFSANFEQRLGNISEMGIQTNVVKIGDEFEVNVALDGNEESGSLHEQLAKGRRYIEKGGKVILINQQKLDELNALSSKISGDRNRPWNTSIRLKAKPWELCDLEGILEESSANFAAPEEWKQRSQALKNLSKLEEAPVSKGLSEKLRIYQKIGVAWLYHLFRNQLGGILADEMGLGKTIQAISLIGVIRRNDSNPALVVCPAGLVGNWKRELSTFAPDLSVYCHHGSMRQKNTEEWGSYGVVITSYSTLNRDEDLFLEKEFCVTIADEAQHIKNRRTKHSKSLKLVRSSGRFLLTGTPIENSMNDLVSLFEFLLPGYLEKPKGQMNPDDRAWYQQRIKERAAPYILRRTKKQVAPELPEKIEQTILCDMDAAQKDLYDKTRRKCAEHIGRLEEHGANEGQIKMAVFTELLRLRQVCADPRLLDDRLKAVHSAKYQVFKELLDEAMDGGHRILVFSQFVSLLKLLRSELESQGISFCYIDGSVKDRLAEADRFNQNEDIPVFLISLKAGGTGLNLTGADTVVHYDPWWNPAAEAQATDRAHRIGQEKIVTSLKLIVSGSVEERVQHMQHEKRRLLDDLFEESATNLGKLELADVKSLIMDD